MSDPVIPAGVKHYYDEHVTGKLRDFIHGNARVERAAELVRARAPRQMKRALEIGCGLGAISWRLARTWPSCHVVGSDISPRSIEYARNIFKAPNLEYREGLVADSDFREPFDLILLMDVYEHVPPDQRPALHATIDQLLASGAVVVMTTPTPDFLAYLRAEKPHEIQPVDMDIQIEELSRFAADTRTELIYHQRLSIWRRHDYAHTVFQRVVGLGPNEVESPPRRYQAALKALEIALRGRPTLHCPVKAQRVRMVIDALGMSILESLEDRPG